MQFFAILSAMLGLATVTLASFIDSKSNGCPSPASGSLASTFIAAAAARAIVTGTINKWSTDIDGVNSFVDTISNHSSEAAAKSMAQTALTFAQDEGAQLNVLKLVQPLDATGQAAVATSPTSSVELAEAFKLS